MKLAIPSTLMTCFEWWVYEFGGFFAGNPYLWCEIYIYSIIMEYVQYTGLNQ